MAPSPTGYFHLGSARTALFNWLFARHNKGIFILRIEDTDKARSNPEYEIDIVRELAWLGLGADEGLVEEGMEKGELGPYRQSQRINRYSEYLEKLLSENKAYYCFCSTEELEEARVAELAAGRPPRYSGKCRSLTKEEVEARTSQGKKSVIRFKVADEEIKFKDLVRGEIKFDGGLLGDFVIAKNLEEPLYNFTVVVDDALMEISHVIRGEEHINNTPRQLLMIEALGFTRPSYGHIPLILNSDRSKMSKRSGDTAIKDYRAAGYLPEAVVNFLAFLGFHPEGNDEVVSMDRLVSEFDLGKIQKGGAVFNIDKLDWLNNQYLRAKSNEELYSLIVPEFIDSEWISQGRDKIMMAIDLLKERLAKLGDFATQASLFFELPPYDPKLLIWKKSDALTTEANLLKIKKLFLADSDLNILEEKIMALAEEVGRGDVLWPLRVCLSGSEKSPPPMEIARVLGKDEVLVRISEALDKMSALTNPDSFSK